jgi:hypothetical protein
MQACGKITRKICDGQTVVERRVYTIEYGKKITGSRTVARLPVWSSGLYLQFLGRSLRTNPKKNEAAR